MNLLYIGIILLGYLFNTCYPIWQFEAHKYCDYIGLRTLYLCVDEQGQFDKWMDTCISHAEEPPLDDIELVFLPIMIKGE